jgi:hypothetical protein
VAEKDRVLREEEAKAEHQLRLERHKQQVAMQRQIEERRVWERLAEVDRQQEILLKKKSA